MSNLINKAAQGNRKAMETLYSQYKQRAYYIATSLLTDEIAANQAVVQGFKTAFSNLLKANVSNEKVFEIYLKKCVADACKKVILKKNSKAYQLPAGKNFAILNPKIAENEIDDIDSFVISQFNDLQKLIFVMHIVGEWNTELLASVTKFDKKTAEIALAAEKENIERITAGKKSAEDICGSFARLEALCVVPASVDNDVYGVIADIATPIAAANKKKALTYIVIALAAILIIGAIVWLAGGKDDGNNSSDASVTSDYVVPDKSNIVVTKAEINANDTYFADIEIRNYGTITVQLDQSQAPKTVENFVSLAQSGFYDGLTFHRIMEGFMMQGGDPSANGTGGYKEKLVGEFSANGHQNNISHKRGVISMARSNAYNSASSQFFIMHADYTGLDGNYAAFGHVTEGLDVVDAVCTAAKPTDNNGTIPLQQQPIINKITIRVVKGEETESEESDYVVPDKSDIVVTKAEIKEDEIYYADIVIRDYGTITVQLDQSQAPKTVENFVSLAQSGFYDGLTFHRIMEGFMMQGGDPAANGTGGYKETIVGEFSNNGHQNNISHKRGVISMARAGDPKNPASAYNTASSQFFIMHADNNGLDGDYAAFGQVTEGLDVVDAVCTAAKPIDYDGTIPLKNQPIIEKITIRALKAE